MFICFWTVRFLQWVVFPSYDFIPKHYFQTNQLYKLQVFRSHYKNVALKSLFVKRLFQFWGWMDCSIEWINQGLAHVSRVLNGNLLYILQLGATVVRLLLSKGCTSSYMGVSKNRGTQQLLVFLLKMTSLGCFGGTTILGNTYYSFFVLSSTRMLFSIHDPQECCIYWSCWMDEHGNKSAEICFRLYVALSWHPARW